MLVNRNTKGQTVDIGASLPPKCLKQFNGVILNHTVDGSEIL